jgi:hypothetical protein
MKKLVRRLFLAGTLSALVVSGLIVSIKTMAQERESANGHGSLATIRASNGKPAQRQFSFSAHRNPDGTVQGHAVLHNPAFEVNGQQYQLQIDVTCMKVVGNIAIFGGTTRRTNDPNLVDAVFFTVQDNGEPGKNDRISRAFFWDDDPNTVGDPQACQNTGPFDFPLEQIEHGNIQVRP